MKKVISFLSLVLISILSCSGIENDSSFKTNFEKAKIDISKVLPGGPGKDGIPAINNPKFNNIKETNLDNNILGLLVTINNKSKFYPFNILVWHEIVNDNIDDTYYTVTFCPLCGSGIVFNRKINKEIHNFGVTGYLYESNLLMYDNISESFWSQSIGEAVIGDYTGYKLEIINSSLLVFGTVKKEFPKALILNEETGHTRNYKLYPYGDYEKSNSIYFPISKRDNKYHLKEIMYVFRHNNLSFAFPLKEFKSGNFSYSYDGEEIYITKHKGRIIIKFNNREIPGYYEMWFSWFIHNSDYGVVIDNIN